VTGPLWPRETLELLDTLRLPTVRGEHDRWLGEPATPHGSRSMAFARNALSQQQRCQLGRLPPHFEVGETILAVHGSPRDDAECLLEESLEGRLTSAHQDVLSARLGNSAARVVLCGHSHVQHMARGPDGCLIVNPGSIGDPRNAGDTEIGRAETGSPHARFAVLTWRSAGLTVEMIALEYDWATVSRRAEENNRIDWARAFLEPI
jgi:diadenosine tetraphosphatase ApaH/serine/threonine PP2A family protein phosphatase